MKNTIILGLILLVLISGCSSYFTKPCGADRECLIQALETCENVTAEYTIPMIFIGQADIFVEVKDGKSVDNCSVRLRTKVSGAQNDFFDLTCPVPKGTGWNELGKYFDTRNTSCLNPTEEGKKGTELIPEAVDINAHAAIIRTTFS